MSTYDLFHRAQQAPGLSQTQKGILVALLTFADSDGWAWPAISTLAAYASVKERAAQSALADLVAAGLVLRVERPGSTCRLRLMLDKLPERGARPAPPQQMHPRSKDTPAPDAGEGCTKSTPGVQEVRGRGAPDAPEGSIEGSNQAAREEASEAPPDWDAIEAAILKARDAEIESYFTAPIQPPPAPEPTTRKPGPDFGALFGKLTTTAAAPAPEQEPPPAPTLPPDLDLLQMLTSRPDGGQAQPLAVAQRWHRALVTAGLTSPADLERYTLREIQMLPGMSAPSAGHVRDAVEAWGGALAMGGRELVDSLRRRAFSGKLSPTPAEKRLMDAANIRPLDIRQMSDFDVHAFAQRLDQARSRHE